MALSTHWLLVLLAMLICSAMSSGASEVEILLKFKNSLSNDSALYNWNELVSPCSGEKANWNGLRCSNNSVSTLQLENMGLGGLIDIDSLMGLPNLRSISFINNNFFGPMPNIKKLVALKALYLSNNHFSGEIPDDAFRGMTALKKVYLAQNDFTGQIPKSLVKLKRLLDLDLEGNRFQGHIPDFPQKELDLVNLANNQFEGPIPASLSKMDVSSFLGNKDLCGKPLDPCKPKKKRSLLKIVIIIVAVGLAAIAAMGAILYIIRGRQTQKSKFGQPQAKKAYEKVVAHETNQKEVYLGNSKRGSEDGKLYFVRNDRESFELQDLLRSSAQVLGSGSFGSSYKATLLSGPTMVVKRFRHRSNVGKADFFGHMRRLGRLSHPNLLPLVAFYYKKEEKLLVSDFVKNGSLASHLHGKRAPGQPELDWPIRLKIIKGVARGLECLYKQLPDLIVPHGHLKSSNVLLDHTFEPVLSDYALVPVVNKEHAQQFMAAYKSPEFTQCDHTTRKTDVWCLGILILEILTGKFPANFLKQGKGANNDLATWVNSVVREEWTGEVFDNDMCGTKNGEGEMLKLLKIGMGCCEYNLERRWDLKEAIEKIEELRERDSDEDYSSNASERDVYSSRAVSDDDFSFSVNK